jgi:hypothetical protein
VEAPRAASGDRPTYVFLASTDSRYYTGEVFAPTGFQTTSR